MRLQKTERSALAHHLNDPQLLLLCLFVAAGAVAGYLAQKTVGTASNAELGAYLQQYADTCARDAFVPASFLQVLAVYFRYPLVAFCLGFCTIGVYLLPILCMVQGFFLSFSICCFAAALGSCGVYLAFAALGLRTLVTLPCLLLLALQAFNRAKALRGTTRRRNTGKRSKVNQAYFILPGICSAALLLGAVLDITLLPHVFGWVLDKIA